MQGHSFTNKKKLFKNSKLLSVNDIEDKCSLSREEVPIIRD